MTVKSASSGSPASNEKPTRRTYNRETERDYLDVEIGRAVLGEPARSLIEVAAASGLSRSGVFVVERRYLLKVGRAVRATEAEEW